jgi:heme/copper-type cytochrome/quinol oxidase subunit 3
VASPTLALPSAGGTRPRRVLTMAVLFLAAGGGMMFAALLGAYLHMRRLAEPFPPPDTEIDQYWGNLMVLTMLMGSVTVEWARSALDRGQRKEGVAGFAVTLGLGLAFLNLMSFAAGHVEFDAVTHPYGTVVAALTMLLGLVVGLSVAFVSLTLFRVAGRQLLEPGADQPRATAWAWHFATVAAVAVWYTVIVLK